MRGPAGSRGEESAREHMRSSHRSTRSPRAAVVRSPQPSWGDAVVSASLAAHRVAEASRHAAAKDEEAAAAAEAAGSASREEALASIEASRLRSEARTAAAEAAAAEEEALHAARAADQARIALLPGSPTANRGVGKAMETWDLHVAVHCVKPTGKPQPANVTLDELIARARAAEADANHALEDREAALIAAQQQVVQLKHEAHLAREVHGAASSKLRMLLERQAELDNANSHSTKWPRQPHTPATTRDAWLSVLRPLEGVLRSLHASGFIEHACIGFVRSDSSTWRKFWTQRSTPRNALQTDADGSSVTRLVHSIECVAPARECHCAYCAMRCNDVDRSGAHETLGENGVYVEGNVRARPTDDVHGDALDIIDRWPATGSGEGGDSEDTGAHTVGTRVSGVVRVRAESHEVAMEFLRARMVKALYKAKHRRDGYRLFDVTWPIHGKTAQPRPMHGVNLPRSPTPLHRPLPLSTLPLACRVRPNLRHRSADGPRPAARRLSQPAGATCSHACAFSALPPPTCAGNPHSAILLDVQSRLLRTSGSSFSYVAGRSQSDQSLPWIGIGRHERDFEADRLALRSSLRPSLSPHTIPLHASSPRPSSPRTSSPRPSSPRPSSPRPSSPRPSSPRSVPPRSSSPSARHSPRAMTPPPPRSISPRGAMPTAPRSPAPHPSLLRHSFPHGTSSGGGTAVSMDVSLAQAMQSRGLDSTRTLPTGVAWSDASDAKEWPTPSAAAIASAAHAPSSAAEDYLVRSGASARTAVEALRAAAELDEVLDQRRRGVRAEGSNRSSRAKSPRHALSPLQLRAVDLDASVQHWDA